ncbi:DinB family protein [Arsenicibacter rosenii]|uniref:DinB-like domain-containing protein n=1 Tax=Arsenicibacter rosenii TaxID=1750698 RepID=A0A1S2VFM2_9BACT|nr:DinB family protein [Arsenicibacter rosenii]OIN57499.1 hypothetical protein BLX24_19940 [Arsenicibacter rosenii]
MSIKSSSSDIFRQLTGLLHQLSNSEYAQPLVVLSGNTIGKHVRHILEFFDILVVGAQTGAINYDTRQRDMRLETDIAEALERMYLLDRSIHRMNLYHPLTLEGDLSADGGNQIQIPSTFARELLYNIEHAIHHMALIQVAVKDSFYHIVLPPHFGVAYSTVHHQHSH